MAFTFYIKLKAKPCQVTFFFLYHHHMVAIACVSVVKQNTPNLTFKLQNLTLLCN
jgi:hypothetical protein